MVSIFEADVADQATATTLAEKLRSRQVTRLFSVNYRLYARLTTSESEVHVESISIRSTNAVKNLSAAGRAFTIGVSPEQGNAVIGNNDVITRDQKSSFEASLKNQISVDYIIEAKQDQDFLDTKLAEFSNTVFKEQQIGFDSVGAVSSHLLAYDFSATDLVPDKIQNLAIEAKNAMNAEDQSKVSYSGSASGSFMGFGGSVSASYSREQLKKQMQDKGWTFGSGVEAYVPKSLSVYIVDKSALQSVADVNISVSRRLREVPLFPVTAISSVGIPSEARELGAAPTGTIIGFGGTADRVPQGWLLCDGRTVKRDDYPSLFSVIGKTFGGSPDSDSFNLPDLRGRFPLGAGQGGNWTDVSNPANKPALSTRSLGEVGGEEKHRQTIDEMAWHTHRSNFYFGPFNAEGGVDPGESPQGIGAGSHYPGNPGAPANSIVAHTGHGVPFNIMPPFMVINYIIKC